MAQNGPPKTQSGIIQVLDHQLEQLWVFFLHFDSLFFANKKTLKDTKIYSSFVSSTGTIVSLKSMKIFDKLIGARGFSCISTQYMKFCTQPANYTSEKLVHFSYFQKYYGAISVKNRIRKIYWTRLIFTASQSLQFLGFS